MGKKRNIKGQKHSESKRKKKVSVLVQDEVDYVDWKDVKLLQRFMSDRSKIRASSSHRQQTPNSRSRWRLAVKNAREMALLPLRQPGHHPARPEEPRRRRPPAAAARGIGRRVPEDRRPSPRSRRCGGGTGSRCSRGSGRGGCTERGGNRVSNSTSRVLLRENVSGVGQKGDIVDVAIGYARNYLVPRGLAIKATEGMRAQAEAMQRARDTRDATARADAEQVASKLVPQVIRVEARASDEGKLFGSITGAELAAAIAEQADITIDGHDIHFDESVKALGTHQAQVRLHSDVQFPVTFEVVAAS